MAAGGGSSRSPREVLPTSGDLSAFGSGGLGLEFPCASLRSLVLGRTCSAALARRAPTGMKGTPRSLDSCHSHADAGPVLITMRSASGAMRARAAASAPGSDALPPLLSVARISHDADRRLHGHVGADELGHRFSSFSRRRGRRPSPRSSGGIVPCGRTTRISAGPRRFRSPRRRAPKENGFSACLADPSCSPPRRRDAGGDGAGRKAAETAPGQTARLGPARCLLSDPMTWRHLRRSRTWARGCKHDAGDTERRSLRGLGVRTAAAEAPPGQVMPSDSFGARRLGRFRRFVARPRLAASRPMELGRRCRTGGGLSTP